MEKKSNYKRGDTIQITKDLSMKFIDSAEDIERGLRFSAEHSVKHNPFTK